MVFKIAVIAAVCCIAALSFKKINESISVLIVISADVIITAFILSHFISAADDISRLFSFTGLNASYLKIMFKCLGISLVAGFAADICEDASYHALSSQIILAGKVSVLLLSLPLFEAVLKMCIGMIKG